MVVRTVDQNRFLRLKFICLVFIPHQGSRKNRTITSEKCLAL